MDVLPEAGAVLVAFLKKGALDDEDPGLAHHVGPFEGFQLDVTKVADERNLCSSGDFSAFVFELDDLGTTEAEILFKQFFPAVVDQISERGCGMGDAEGLDEQVATDFVFVAAGQGHDSAGRDLAFDAVPSSEHLFDGFGYLLRHQGGAGLHSLEIALGEIIGQCRGVVHVAVGQADVAAGEGDARAKADIEADVKLGDGHGRLLAGNADAAKAQLATTDSTAGFVLHL